MCRVRGLAERYRSALPCADQVDAHVCMQALIEEGKRLKEEVAAIEVKQAELEEAMQVEGQRVPNLTHPDVPSGGEENATLRKLVRSP